MSYGVQMVWGVQSEKKMFRLFLLRGLSMIFGLACGVCALAGEDARAFSYDKVLVTTVQPYDADDVDIADQITAQWSELLSSDAVIVPMSSVPVFQTQGYDATTYMRSCPAGSYAGCALVVGARAKADWAIGATLERVLMRADGLPMWSLTVHVVDVSGAVEVVSFALTYDSTLQDVLSEGVRRVFQEVLLGVHHGQDIRADAITTSGAVSERLAKTLEDLEISLGAIEQRDSVRVIEPPKLTQDDLGSYRKGESPWERLGLSERAYLLFRNSGLFLDDWTNRRRLARGALSVRGGVHGGAGPFGVSYQGAYLRDPAAGLEVVGRREMLSSVYGGNFGGGLDVGVGLTGWLEVGAFVGARSVSVEVVEDAQLASDSVNLTSSSAMTQGRATVYGGFVRAVTRPAFVLRPGLHIGLGVWAGPTYEPSDEQLSGLPALQSAVVSLKPLLEVRLADHYGLVASVGAQGRVGPGVATETRAGDASGLTFPTASPPQAWGVAVSLELQARIRLKKLPSGPSRPEPLLLGESP